MTCRHFLPCIIPALFSLVVTSCKPAASGPPPGANRAPTVTVTDVESREIPDEVKFVGRVATRDRVDIRAQVSGTLEKQAFEDGALVEEGDLLFEIDPDDYEAALASADAEVASAKAELDNAQQYINRLKAVKRGGVSATEMENAEIAIRKAKAVLDIAESAKRMAELDLERTKIFAPIDGQIGKAMVDAGNLVDSSTGTLATIVRMDPIRVQHALSERFLTQALQRQKERDASLPPVRDTLIPRITLSTGDRYPHEGKIVFLDNEVGATTGSIQAEAEFPNPDRTLRPGQFVELSVQRGAPQRKMLVPQSAVQQDQKGHFVLIVDGEGNVTQRRVEAGARIGPDWAIDQGVAAGEKVIIQGIEKVRPGAKVNSVEPSKAPVTPIGETEEKEEKQEVTQPEV